MALPTIACKDCGHINEGERIYCHNCGTKLDRSIVSPNVQTVQESPEQRQRRVKKMLNPDAGLKPGYWINTTLKTLFYAAITAALVNMALPPENIAVEPEVAQAIDLSGVVKELANAPASRRVVITTENVNDFLRGTIRSDKKGGGFLRFHRVYSHIDPAGIEITMERRIFDYPIHLRTKYDITSDNKQLAPKMVGGSIGRLTIPAPILPLFDKTFNQVWGVLDRDYKQLQGVWKIETIKDGVVLSSKPLSARPSTFVPASMAAPVKKNAAPPDPGPVHLTP